MEEGEDAKVIKNPSIISGIYTEGKLARNQEKHQGHVDRARFGTRKEQKSLARKVASAWERMQAGDGTPEDSVLLSQNPHIVSSIESRQRAFETHLPEDQLETATARLRQGLRIPEVQEYVSSTYPRVHGEVPNEIRELVKPVAPDQPLHDSKTVALPDQPKP